MKNDKDLDFEFDFEKEYGFDPSAIEGEDDFDLDALMASDFNEDDSYSENDPVSEPGYQDPDEYFEGQFHQDPQQELEEEFYQKFSQELQQDSNLTDDFEFDFKTDSTPASEAEDFELDPEMQIELGLTDEPQETVQEEPIAPPQKVKEPDAAPARPERRRKRPPVKKTKKQAIREFKNVQLPLIIASVAALLIVCFVINAIVLAVQARKEKNQAAIDASISVQNEEQRVEGEVKALLDEAAVLAAGYDYDAAIEKLDSFTGQKDKYTDLQRMRAQYVQNQSQMKAWEDPSKIANLSFHMLIADPARAFGDQKFGKSYNTNFVTTEEFSQILDQLHANGYVLVNFDSFVEEVVGDDGHVTYKKKPIYLPDGKKPIMLTETMVNYFAYMIDSDGDGVADKGGDGFASRLVVDSNGEIKAEMVDAEGNTVVGNYDLVPILNDFIKAHPDFSYRGARATLAVTGHEGVFGYRTNKAVQTKNQAFYEEQVAGAKQIVEALRAGGYKIACYSYANKSYGNGTSATDIKDDLQKWNEEVTPVLGNVDILVYAKGSDISGAGSYSGSKYDVLRDAGFRYFVGSANAPWAEVNDQYVRQQRIMVTGSRMAHSSSQFIDYFTSKTVLNQQRGEVPQK